MNHSEISVWDLVIIAVYLITMISIGVYSIKRVKNRGDYYVAGRSFGPMVLMATVCATIIGGSGLMGRAGVAYSSGFKAIITAVPYLLGMLIFSWIAGRISDIGMKYNITSIPELFEMRFGKTAKLLLSMMIAFTMMGTVASQVTATATIVKMLGGQIGLSYEIGALIACVVFMLYTATFGLYGVVYPMESVSTGYSLGLLNRTFACPAMATIFFASVIKDWPSGVISTSLVERWKSFTFNSLSSDLIWCVIAGWEMFICSAARAKLREFATAKKQLSWKMFMYLPL